jgi:putative membrane protein insertion efficiency factor
MRYIALIFIKGYQHTFGRIFPRVCRYEPTCSTYAYQAITRFGLIRGVGLGIWRIIRCNPLTAGGFDPIPDRWRDTKCVKNR